MPFKRHQGRDRGSLAAPRAHLRRRSYLSTGLAVALLLAVASPAVAQAPSTSSPPASPPISASSVHPYAGHVAEASQRFGIPEPWIWSVMRVESAGNPAATSHAGAMGLMQVMPGTYAELRSRYGLGLDAYDPRNSILAGTAYLREMHDRYGATGMLAAYNAGPGRWEDYVSRARPLPGETVAYMARLAPLVGSSAAPSPTMVVQVDRFAWRRASLFAALSHDLSQAASGQTDDDSEADRSRDEVRPTSNTTAASSAAQDGLFAVRRPE